MGGSRWRLCCPRFAPSCGAARSKRHGRLIAGPGATSRSSPPCTGRWRTGKSTRTPTGGAAWRFRSFNDGGTMGDLKVSLQGKKDEQEAKTEKVKPGERLTWETPKMEDVSEQVMAQPYIRFT